jgi:hypothetical protein
MEWMREHYRAKGETPRESQSRGQLAGMMSIRSRFWVRPQQSIDARTSASALGGPPSPAPAADGYIELTTELMKLVV